MYEYKAIVTRVVDGDTFHALVDLGFGMYAKHIFRLKDVDTPETYRPKCEAEREHGKLATKFVRELIENKDVILRTHYLGIYGRYVAEVIIDKDKDLATLLRENGLVKLKNYEDWQSP